MAVAIVVLFALAPPTSIIPFIVILGLLRLDEIHQVRIEGTLFDLLPARTLLADPAQPHDLHLAVDVDPALVSPATAEAAAFLIIGITKSPTVDSIAVDAVHR